MVNEPVTSQEAPPLDFPDSRALRSGGFPARPGTPPAGHPRCVPAEASRCAPDAPLLRFGPLQEGWSARPPARGGPSEDGGTPGAARRGRLAAAGRPKAAAWEELASAWEDPRPAHARGNLRRPVFRGLGGIRAGSGGVSPGSGGLREHRDHATWGNAAGEPPRRTTRGGRSSKTAKSGPSGDPPCVHRGADRCRRRGFSLSKARSLKTGVSRSAFP